MQYLSTLLLLSFLFFQCSQPSTEEFFYGNPAAEGFNAADSDEKAIALADSVMMAMGGRQAWDNTSYIKWNFFGSRRHVWNKKTNEVVIEAVDSSFLIKMNLDSMSGDVYLQDRLVTSQDTVEQFLQRGKSWWINDSYWIVMPFKLKDSGVTLGYLGSQEMLDGNIGEVVSLTFEDVGVTPENKYHIYIHPETFMVHQWDYYTTSQDSLPRFAIPWEDYKRYDNILLSSGRGDNRNITEIEVGEGLASYFN